MTAAIARRYSSDARTSEIGAAASAASAAGLGQRPRPAIGADERSLGGGDAANRRRKGGDRDTGFADDVAVQRHGGGRADDGDLHLPSVLEPDVAAAGAGAARAAETATISSSGRSDGPPGPGEKGRRAPTAACPRPTTAARPRRRSRAAARTVSAAGDAFARLPPSVPTCRVAGEPTIDGGIGERRPPITDARDGPRGRRGSSCAPIRSPPPNPIDRPAARPARWSETRSSGSVHLPCRVPTTRSVPPATGRGPPPRRPARRPTQRARRTLGHLRTRRSSR